MATQLAIGDCIQGHVDRRGGDPTGKIEARLWSYITKTTDNSRSGPHLATLYVELRGEAAPRLPTPASPLVPAFSRSDSIAICSLRIHPLL